MLRSFGPGDEMTNEMRGKISEVGKYTNKDAIHSSQYRHFFASAF